VRLGSRILVGREREIDLLDEIARQAMAFRGGSAWIVGEPGMGKTRLLSEAAARAAARGFAVAWGRGWERGSAPKYWPWLEILRSLLARPAAPPERASPLAALLELRRSASDGSDNETPGAHPFPVYDAVQSYLRAHSATEPIALVFDDLHAADPASLELAEFVVSGLSDCRIAIFASQCDLLQRARPGLDVHLSRLARRSERITLSPLSYEHVVEWLQQATGDRDLTAARRVHEASDGNPLFASELLRLALLERPLSAGELPPTLRTLIHERVSALGPRQINLLRAAAIIGRTFSLTLWADVTGASAGLLASVAHEACQMGLLTAAERGQYRFVQALVAETLVLELHPVERAALHQRAAEVLEQRHDGHPTAPLENIAHHWLEAGAEAAPLAAAAAERAARQASARLALAEAARMYERAIEAQLSLSPIDARRLTELYIALVDVLARAEQRGRAEEVCARAVELARGLRDGALLARAALALGADRPPGELDPPILLLLDQALAWLPDEGDPLAAVVRARLASEGQTPFDPVASLERARRAIATVRGMGDERLLLSVIQAGSGALMGFAPAEERAAVNGEALELAMRLWDRPSAFRALERLAFDRLELGDVTGFEQALVQCEALASEMRDPRHAWVPLMFRSMRAEWQGAFARAARLEREARAAREQGHGEGARLVPGRALARALLLGDAAALEGVTRDLETSASEDPNTGLLVALLAVWRGREADARRALEALAARGFAALLGRDGLPSSSNGACVDGAGLNDAMADASLASAAGRSASSDGFLSEVCVEIAWRLNEVGWAERLYRKLEGRAGKAFVMTSNGFSLYGVVDHALVRASAVLGRWSQVEGHAEAALAWCERMRAQPLRARIFRDSAALTLGRAQVSAGTQRAELVARASALAGDGERIAVNLGMDAIASHCRSIIAKAELIHTAHPTLAERGMKVRYARHALLAPPFEAGAETLELMREGDYWTVRFAGELCRVQDGRGMQMLALLASNPGRQFHVLELSGVPASNVFADAGSLLDTRARSTYRERLRELRAELDEAGSNNDLARQERLQEEADALTRELARAFGLGGRERRGASVVERARVNVRRRLTLAVRRIRAASPNVGDAIAAALRTGVHCVYRPKH
jgi:hypothetical protein